LSGQAPCEKRFFCTQNLAALRHLGSIWRKKNQNLMAFSMACSLHAERAMAKYGQVFWRFFWLEKVTYYAAWLPSKVTKLVIGFAILTHYSTIRGNVCETMWIYIILNNFDTFFVTL
jgi:hypothetical protein